jgi:DNA-binding transcriptional LysR family regulator
MQFDVKQLLVFVTVAEQASFSRAAGVLGLAQASVSERIATLEKAVGTRLLDRLGRKTVPTAAGELLLTRARELIAQRDAIEAELKGFLGLAGGEVRLGGSTAPGEYRLPRLLGPFAERYPGVDVRLSIADSDRILEQLEEGRLDLGVVGKRVKSPALTFSRTWRDRLVLAVHGAHRWAARRKPLPAAELGGEPWLFRETGSATRAVAERFLQQSAGLGVEALRLVAELGSVGAIKEGLKAGLGVALMSEMTITAELEAGSLVAVPVEGLSIERAFYLARDKRRARSPAARALWRFIGDAARDRS